MEANIINTITQDIASLQSVRAQELEMLTERYPWFQLPYLFTAKKMHSVQHPSFQEALKKAAIHAYSREALFQLVEKTPLQTISENDIPEMKTEAGNELVIAAEVSDVVNTDEKIQADIPLQEDGHTDQITDPGILTKENDEINTEDVSSVPVENISEISVEQQEPETDTIEPLKNALDTTDSEGPGQTEGSENKDEVEVKSINDTQESSEGIIYNDKELLHAEIPVEELKDVENQEEHSKADVSEEPIFEFNLYELQLLKDVVDVPLEELVKDISVKLPEKKEALDLTASYDFSTWLRKLPGVGGVQLVKMRQEQQPIVIQSDIHALYEREFDEDDASVLAKKSVQMHDGLVTETYANILAQQGKTQKAIEMLQKLSLKYPQKSVYFASRIQELKK